MGGEIAMEWQNAECKTEGAKKDKKEDSMLFEVQQKKYSNEAESIVNDIELLNELSRDDYYTLSHYFYYDKEYLQGLSVKEIDEFMHRDYLTSIVKKLCDIYHEQEKLVKCKTYLITEFKLTDAQKEKFITCRTKNIKRILKNK